MRPKNIVIITVDAMRKETLKCYNDIDGVSLGFSELFNNAVVYDYMFTTIPETYQGLGSLLTGLYPYNHKIAVEPLDRNIPTLMDYFKDTHKMLIFTTEPPLGESLLYEEYREFNLQLEEGRHDLRQTPPNVSVIKSFIQDNKDTPFFLMTHLWSPRRYAVQKEGDFKEYIVQKRYDEVWQASLKLVEEAGHAVEEIYQELKNNGLLDNTVLIVTADHGDHYTAEEETKGFYKVTDLIKSPGVRHTEIRYNSAVNVPFFLYDSDIKPRRVKDIVSFVDVLPTVLDIFDIKKKRDVDGMSHYQLIKNDQNLQNRDIFIDRSPTSNVFTIVTQNGYKLITLKKLEYGVKNIYLFNFFSDPLEKNDISEENLEIVEDLTKRLLKFNMDTVIRKHDIIFRYLNYRNIKRVESVFTELGLDDWKNKSEFYNTISWVTDTNMLDALTQCIYDKNSVKNVLEIGIGTGIVSKHLRKTVDANFHGIDLSPSMMIQVQDSTIDLITNDAHAISHASSKFDLIIMRDVATYLKDIERVFSEVYRLLRPNGIFLFCEEIAQHDLFFQEWYRINLGVTYPNKDINFYKTRGYSKQDFIQLFEKNNIVLQSDRDIVLKNQSLNNYLLMYDRVERTTIKRRYHDASRAYRTHINFSEDPDIRSGQPYGDIHIDLTFTILKGMKNVKD